MSHFTTLVLIDPEQRADLTAELDRLLAPFSEELEVEEYDHKCWCVGKLAREEMRQRVKEEVEKGNLPDIDKLRETIHALSEEEQTDKLWKQMIEPLVRAEKEFFNNHPAKDAPDPTCEECHGTGTYRSTYNPQSEWDWWVIGGRWDGALFSKLPNALASILIEIEMLIKQASVSTADRDILLKSLKNLSSLIDPTLDWGELRQKINDLFRELARAYCWPFNTWFDVIKQFETNSKYNVRLVSEIAAETDPFMPFAILAPDGQWHEHGKMGWWGAVSNEKEEDNWATEVKEIYAQYPDKLAVLVDCHI